DEIESSLSVHVMAEVGALLNRKWRYFSSRVSVGFVPEKNPQLFLGVCLGVDNYDAFYTIPFSFSFKYYFSEKGFKTEDEWSISCLADFGTPLSVHEKVEYIENFGGGHPFYDLGLSLHSPFSKPNFLFTIYYKHQSINEWSILNEYTSTNYSSFNLNIGILF
ncbi:MAG TPA: hypothetical protein VJY62_02330, partial [Bacteroidia bacterium]|nr:hypothetical protein [Bacteroidia bacterium]